MINVWSLICWRDDDVMKIKIYCCLTTTFLINHFFVDIIQLSLYLFLNSFFNIHIIHIVINNKRCQCIKITFVKRCVNDIFFLMIQSQQLINWNENKSTMFWHCTNLVVILFFLCREQIDKKLLCSIRQVFLIIFVWILWKKEKNSLFQLCQQT